MKREFRAWVAHASRVLVIASSRSRTFLVTLSRLALIRFKKKIVSARRRNQHARRLRYPGGDSTPHRFSSITRMRAPISAAVRSNPTHSKGQT